MTNAREGHCLCSIPECRPGSSFSLPRHRLCRYLLREDTVRACSSSRFGPRVRVRPCAMCHPVDTNGQRIFRGIQVLSSGWGVEGKPRKFYFFPWASNKGKDSWQNIEGMRCSELRDPMQRGNKLRCGRSAPEEVGMTDLIQRSAVGKETTGRKKTTHLGTTTPLHDPSMQWMRLLQNSVVLLLRLSTAQPLSTSFLPSPE